MLLGAVDLERSAAGQEIAEMNATVREIQARLSGGKLNFGVDELPRANQAATAIQKVFRGNLARKR